MLSIPLDQPESDRLEFKSQEVLEEPAKVAREVVAMLNSLPEGREPGEIWIGVRHEPGHVEVQALQDIETRRARLQDHLIDVIEPQPTDQEVAVTAVPASNLGGPVLLVTVRPPAPFRRPFALLRSPGSRQYVRRFADRVLPMSREEVAAAFTAAAQGEPSSKSESAGARLLRKDLEQLLEQRPPARLWLRMEPATGGEIDFDQVERSGLLTDPALSGTPRESFNFAMARSDSGVQPLPGVAGLGGVQLGDPALFLRLYENGGLQFEAELRHVAAGEVPFVREARLLSPECLLGYVVSTLRLTRTLLREPSVWRQPPPPKAPILALLAIPGLEGWGLLPGNLGNWGTHRFEIRRFDGPAFVSPCLSFTQPALLADADGCAMHLLRRLYGAFGFFRDRDLPTLGAAALVPEAGARAGAWPATA